MEALKQEINTLEQELMEKSQRIAELKRQLPSEKVENYTFDHASGTTLLSDLFGTQEDLIVIHNMGTSCRYCTLWADGYNGMLAHLEDRTAFVLISPDSPKVQQEFAQSRQWKFPMVSAQGCSFIEDMGFKAKDHWMPGVSSFHKDGDSIERIASSPLGPFDSFCSVWHLFALLKAGVNAWQPQYQYQYQYAE